MEDISRPAPSNIWEAQVQGLLENYSFLEARLSEVEDQLRLTPNQPAKPASTKEPKIADPEPFKGDRI